MKKYKRPTKKEIDYLRIAVGLSSIVCIDNHIAELILVTQSEMEKLGGGFSLRDASNIGAHLKAKWEKESKPVKK